MALQAHGHQAMESMVEMHNATLVAFKEELGSQLALVHEQKGAALKACRAEVDQVQPSRDLRAHGLRRKSYIRTGCKG